MSGRKRKAPAGHSKAPSKRPARGSTSMPTPGPGPTAQTVTAPAQIATKTVLDYLQKNGLVAKATTDTDKFREINVQQTQQTGHATTNMNLETNNLNQGSSITSTPPPCRLDKTRFTSSRVPLHATVNLKKKEKIWANEFIELSTLQEDEVKDISFNIHTGAVSSNTSKKKFLAIEQWTDAFNIYASVRRLKYPEEAKGLAAYMGVVHRIAQERGSWHFYDTNFRRLRQTTNYAWDEIENELFLVALSRKSSSFRPNRHQERRQPSQGLQASFLSCFKFNKGVPCDGCKYPHVCGDCGRSNHGRHRCWTKWGTNEANSNINTQPTANQGSTHTTYSTNGKSK